MTSLFEEDPLARFHHSPSTTKKYYIDECSTRLIDNIFKLPLPKVDFERSSVVIQINYQQ
jgi:hypothetical protein